jgi:hypothetical protein
MIPLDVTKPNVARMYDYWLGGKDNFEADRRAADAVRQLRRRDPRGRVRPGRARVRPAGLRAALRRRRDRAGHPRPVRRPG